MSDESLFGDLPQSEPRRAPAAGAARLREPVRDQIELRPVDLDALIASDHPARIIWDYAVRLNLEALEAGIKAREGRPGHPSISPRLLVALWLLATSEGVGSARALARLCESSAAYRWMVGGVSVNYHTLSDFRVDHADLLDALLSQNVAALAAAGLIDLKELAQDGLRVRAAAGAGSYRRSASLHEHLSQARQLIERLKRELDEDPDASNRRRAAARERVAQERAARIEAALEQLKKLEAERERRSKTNAKTTAKQKEPRASTTDPEARVMKMPDGGFRPGWNMQIASAAEQQIVVDVAIDATGSDRGLLQPMLAAIQRRLSQLPKRYAADAGYTKNIDIEWAAQQGVDVYCPPINAKQGTDPFALKPDDGPGVAAWRARMASDAGKAHYKRRAIAECVNARARSFGLTQLTVRGRDKARAALLWFALANNVLQGHRLALQAA